MSKVNVRATDLLNAKNKLSEDSVGTNSRWALRVAANVEIIRDLYVSLFEE